MGADDWLAQHQAENRADDDPAAAAAEQVTPTNEASDPADEQTPDAPANAEAAERADEPASYSRVQLDVTMSAASLAAARLADQASQDAIRHVADVRLELDEALPPVWCDIASINQVVLNLVVNAAHAMKAMAESGHRGTLTIRTDTDGGDAVLQVSDTGAGIPPEIADRIFEQFFTTKAVGQGTGQGLALAHTLIHDRHGGTITFASTPGAGTTFTVRLPNREP